PSLSRRDRLRQSSPESGTITPDLGFGVRHLETDTDFSCHGKMCCQIRIAAAPRCIVVKAVSDAVCICFPEMEFVGNRMIRRQRALPKDNTQFKGAGMRALVFEMTDRLQNLSRLFFSNWHRRHGENIDIALGNEIAAMSKRAVQQNTSQFRS